MKCCNTPFSYLYIEPIETNIPIHTKQKKEQSTTPIAGEYEFFHD